MGRRLTSRSWCATAGGSISRPASTRPATTRRPRTASKASSGPDRTGLDGRGTSPRMGDLPRYGSRAESVASKNEYDIRTAVRFLAAVPVPAAVDTFGVRSAADLRHGAQRVHPTGKGLRLDGGQAADQTRGHHN